MFEIFATICLAAFFGLFTLASAFFHEMRQEPWTRHERTSDAQASVFARQWRSIAVIGALGGVFAAGSLPRDDGLILLLYTLWSAMGGA